MTTRKKLRKHDIYKPLGNVGLTAECPNCEELIPIFGHVCGECGYKVKIEFVAKEITDKKEDTFVAPKEATQ